MPAAAGCLWWSLLALGFLLALIARVSALPALFEGGSIRKKFVQEQHGMKWKRGMSLIQKKKRHKQKEMRGGKQ